MRATALLLIGRMDANVNKIKDNCVCDVVLPSVRAWVCKLFFIESLYNHKKVILTL